MSNTNELLPCKCGCNTQSWWRHMKKGHVVTCDNIFCSNDANGIDMAQAGRDWNTRAK